MKGVTDIFIRHPVLAIVVNLVLVLVVAVASFNIICSLVMSVRDKQAEIAILRLSVRPLPFFFLTSRKHRPELWYLRIRYFCRFTLPL